MPDKSILKENLITIFRDICFNNENVVDAKKESDLISEEIRAFILGYIKGNSSAEESEIIMNAKRKGLELVENHELIFFEDNIGGLKMRAFLIPGINIETGEGQAEEITEHDMQSIDHELCISFRTEKSSGFTKIGNLIDIRANLAKSLGSKSSEDEVVRTIISNNETFKEVLEEILESLAKVISEKD